MQDAEKTLMELVEEHGPHVYRLAVSLTGNAQDAEDVLQQTFLRAYPHLNQFSNKLSPRPWLMRMAASEALLRVGVDIPEKPARTDEAIESIEHLSTGEIVDWGDKPEQRYTNAELQRITSEALAALDLPLRSVVALRDMAKFSIPEITHFLNLSTPSVKGRLLRGRLKLRAHLNKYFKPGQGAGSLTGPGMS